MPRNGSGGYDLPPGINPVVTQTLITSNWANTTLNDVAVALTNSLSKDGQTIPTANLPMGGFGHTGAAPPAARDMYSTLGFVQDGSHFRLTNVAGVNQVTATLVGGTTSISTGQLVQFIPANSNTGAVTLNINGIGFVPVKTDGGNDLATGNLVAGRPYLLSYTGTQWVIAGGGGGGSGVGQATMSGWDRPTPGGPYPPLTQVNPTTVSVPGGTGRIVKPSARDLSGVTEVTWATQNVVLSNIATAWSTLLAVNASGQIVQFSGTFNPSWARENIILGTIAHVTGVIEQINTNPAIYGDMTYTAFDTSLLLHNTMLGGGRVFPNAAQPFQIDQEAGTIFTVGGDANDVNDPNRLSFASTFNMSFNPVTGTSAVSAATQNVPVTNYDPNGAGTITPIPGAAQTASIHRLYRITGKFVFLYGQKTYLDLTTALSQIGIDDSSLVPPAKLTNATLLCYIVAQKDCLDLKDTTKARIVAKGGASFNIGSAGSISEAPVDGLWYARRNAGWSETVPVLKGPQSTLRLRTAYTGTGGGALPRWAWGANDTPEGGANAGSNYELRRYNDAGALIGAAITVDRATGNVTLTGTFGSGAITSSGNVSANSNFLSTNTSVVLAPSAAGNIFLRPNGVGSATGQTTIGASGAMQVNGSVTSVAAAHIAGNGQFIGTGSQVALGPTTAGTIFFQPQGVGVATNQGFIDSAGGLNLAGGAVIAGAISVGQNFGSSTAFAVLGPASPVAGTVLLRPNGVNVGTNEVSIASNGNLTVPGNISSGGGTVSSAQNFVSTSINMVLAPTGAGGIFFRPNGAGSSAGQWVVNSAGVLAGPSIAADAGIAGATVTVSGGSAGVTITDRSSARAWQWYGTSDILRLFNGSADIVTIDSSGVITSINQIATSDERLKDRITKLEPRRDLADLIDLYAYVWKSSGRNGIGQIAQKVREVAPEYVHESEDGILAIDKASLAMECILGLARRVKELEEKVK